MLGDKCENCERLQGEMDLLRAAARAEAEYVIRLVDDEGLHPSLAAKARQLLKVTTPQDKDRYDLLVELLRKNP